MSGVGLALELKEVQFSYSKESPNFYFNEMKMKPGEKVFLFGPSGSGKSTLLGLVSGVLSPNQGDIRILGQNLGDLSAHQRDSFRGRHVGYIFQLFNLIPYLSVLDNICLPCRINATRGQKLNSVENTARELAQSLGLANVLSKNPNALSVGQSQRVAVARALIGAPELIIADEPTSALDADSRENFIDVLLTQAKINQTAVLFVSHDRSLEKHFDRSLSILALQKRVAS
jgi:putative ABC transport system ATP-binding protein